MELAHEGRHRAAQAVLVHAARPGDEPRRDRIESLVGERIHPPQVPRPAVGSTQMGDEPSVFSPHDHAAMAVEDALHVRAAAPMKAEQEQRARSLDGHALQSTQRARCRVRWNGRAADGRGQTMNFSTYVTRGGLLRGVLA